MKSLTRTILYFAATVLITAFITASITMAVVNGGFRNTVILSAEEYNDFSALRAITDMADIIDDEYYGDAPSVEEMINAAAHGMIASLKDPYAQYFTAEEYEKYIQSTSGQYSGIGILISNPDGTGAKVLKVYENNPAAEAGMQIGDIITKVDGVAIANLNTEEVAQLVAKPEGESVEITALRNGAEQKFNITCRHVSIKRVFHALYKESTGYIRLDSFTGAAADEFNEALRDLTDKGMKCLVIDLRNNPGGSLDVVLKIADSILGSGTILTIKGKGDDQAEVYASDANGIKIPLAVIVNEHSASASEVFAGAVQDHGAGKIVGTTTFGKGIVQTTLRVAHAGGWLKLTTAGYVTPNGRDINGVGITPDIPAELPENLRETAIEDIPQDDDAQLWAALDYVREAVSGS